jgi:hypothetical protein
VVTSVYDDHNRLPDCDIIAAHLFGRYTTESLGILPGREGTMRARLISANGRPIRAGVMLGFCVAIVACGNGSHAEPESVEHLASDGPCALLELKEVKQALPGASRSERDTSLDKYEINSCLWYGSKAQPLLLLQIWNGEGSTAESELRSRLLGLTDPLRVIGGLSIQMDALHGVGDAASVAVERADEKRGVLTDAAFLVVQRGDRMVLIEARSLAAGDRAAAVDALRKLGMAAASRMAGA